MQELAERGPGDPHDLVRAARDPRHERPHRRDARRHDRRRSLDARRGDAGGDPGAGARATRRTRRRRRTDDVARIAASVSVAVAIARARRRARRASRRGSSRPTTSRDLFLANLPVLIVAIGMTLVILTGQIDISVGSLFAICSVVAGAARQGGPADAARRSSAPAPPAPRSARVNGALVAYARMPSIVVTLATMVALRDGLRWITRARGCRTCRRGFQWLGLVAGARIRSSRSALAVVLLAR